MWHKPKHFDVNNLRLALVVKLQYMVLHIVIKVQLVA